MRRSGLHRAGRSPALRAALGLAVACAAAACGPWGPIPGGRVEGQLVRDPVTDWSFTDAHDTVVLETRPADPHSVTVWAVAHDGHLYVPSRHPEKKRWVENVLADPRVRVAVDGRLYPATATRVEDEAEIEAVVPVLVEKYALDPPDAEDRTEVWIFRVDSRPPEAA